MAAFRALTAEEEAATAVILALKRQRYPGANKLRPWSHIHKNGLWPVLAAVSDALFHARTPPPTFRMSKTGPPRITLHFDMNALTGHQGPPIWVEPDQPLNFSLRNLDAGAGPAVRRIALFEEQLAKLAAGSGATSILEHVEREANRRNELLYASDDGIPHVTLTDDVLLSRAKRVAALVMLAVMILQTSQHQLFVVQCLEALLTALDRMDGAAFDYDQAPPGDRPLIEISRLYGEPATVSITRQIHLHYRLGSMRILAENDAPIIRLGVVKLLDPAPRAVTS